jgi:hypothetical protein
MNKSRIVKGIILGMVLAVFAGGVEAEAKAKQFHASFVGTYTNKDDFSFTGTPVGYGTVAGNSTLGEYTARLVAEIPPDNQTCTPPGGGSGIEFVFVGEVVVLSFTDREEQLFLRLSPNVTSHSCFDLATGAFTGQTTFDVTGGTGRFDGASGTMVKTWKFIGLASPTSPPGKGFFGSFTGTFDGTINITK